MDSLFFQKILCEGQEVPFPLLLTGTYIESKSLNSAKVILHFADRDAGIKDTLKVDEGSQLEITLGDIHFPDGTSFNESFTVVSAKRDDDLTLHVEALQTDIYKLKQLDKPQFFTDKTPEFILKKLFPNAKKYDIKGINGRGTYHIHHNITASAVLSQMARDFGACIFYCRKEVFMYSYDFMKSKKEEKKFEHKNVKVKEEIWKLRERTSNNMLKRKLEKHVLGWSEKEGVIGETKNPTAVLPLDNETFLKNRERHLLPLCEYESTGTTKLHPKDNIKLILNRYSDDSEIDESLPELQIIQSVSHFQKGTTYKCLTVSGVISDDK